MIRLRMNANLGETITCYFLGLGYFVVLPVAVILVALLFDFRGIP